MSDDDRALHHLRAHYHRTNSEKFDGILPVDYGIAFNPHLRRLTGRITYGQRLIEIATFHFQRYGLDDAFATLEHEMLHLWLHQQGLPSGHDRRFRREAERRGIRVFHSNHYPRNRPSRDRWVFLCETCKRMVFRQRRPEQVLACGVCCRNEAGGNWDSRFTLRLVDRVRLA